MSHNCRHCGRAIVNDSGAWIDPQATGDDSVWRETCDAHDTFTAEHEPKHSAACAVCGEWSGSPAPDDPDNFWICDKCGERLPASELGEVQP